MNQVPEVWCAEVQRDPKAIERSPQIPVNRLNLLDDYLAAGITHIVLDARRPDFDLSPLRTLFDWRANQAARARQHPWRRSATALTTGPRQRLNRTT
jgi:hypothetical protein